ncbi:nitrate/nitrite transporter [Lipingzhangella sp. LS1_29]|uniref:Nitrate/nitrite transporter n=1 Tax=Lipingzhangella rawalii TaxID=2055835 RepID=A0ABU2H6F1_9ACTN|nr:nitrate/nitrite transporter [Lipingzhangella rawalii]MDS1270858.1 nitrate/nitrite transporter [Lipingzhangella rawalii]
MAADTHPDPSIRRGPGRWIRNWDPENSAQWERGGSRIARRNLWASIFAEHLGFCVWSLWAVLVLFMTPQTGFAFTAEQKFLLVSLVALVGALIRIPYTMAVPRFGGRNWTLISVVALLVPTLLAAVLVQSPDTPFWVFALLAATAGLGGGNFASSMSNISYFYPERLKGTALGLNAGGGNIGVATVQLLGLAVIALFSVQAGAVVPLVYVPLLLLAALVAWRYMDNLASMRGNTADQVAVCRDRHTWLMSLLYIGTFGSFIGYGFAFGLLLQNQFDRTPIEAATVTFLGPLIGSLIRPLGGWLADRYGGSQVTLWNFLAMVAGTAVIIVASLHGSLAMFTLGFVVLFTLSGIGNGSTYKMIPSIYAAKAEDRIAAGEAREEAVADTKRLAAALLGLVGAIGGLGGVLINMAFRESFAAVGSATPAFVCFLGFYMVCALVTWRVYLRGPMGGRGHTRAAADTVVAS